MSRVVVAWLLVCVGVVAVLVGGWLLGGWPVVLIVSGVVVAAVGLLIVEV